MGEMTPCYAPGMAIHLALAVVNGITAILVAWLTNRARNRDAAERKRNGQEDEKL
jgi:hypothetical protein